MTEGVEGGQGEGGEVAAMIRGDRIIIAVATMTGEGESYTHMHTQAHERNQWPPVILYSVMHNYTLSLSLPPPPPVCTTALDWSAIIQTTVPVGGRMTALGEGEATMGARGP